MSSGFFSSRSRYLICAGCAEVLSAESLDASSVVCPRCARSHSLPPRQTGAEPYRGGPAAPRGSFQGTEEERRERLLAQDGVPLLPPAGLEHLPRGITPENAELFWKAWNEVRASLLDGRGDPAALAYVTRLLRTQLSRLNDRARERALLDSVLDLLSGAHAQTFRCMLARGAAKEADFASAAEWLAGCDARSDSLFADSDYRVTVAYLAIRQGGDPGIVLEQLGRSPAEVPIDETNDGLATVLRADALERSGQIGAAVEQLTEAIQSGRPLDRIISNNVDAGLCRESYSQALQAVGDGEEARRGKSGGRDLARGGLTAFFWVGLVELIAAAAVIAVAVLGATPLGASRENLIFASLALAATGLPLFFVGRSARRGAAQLATIAARGVDAIAHVVAVRPSGTRVAGQSELLLTLNVSLPGQTARRCELTELPVGVEVPIKPGMQLPVRLLGDDLAQVAVDWSRVGPDGRIYARDEQAPPPTLARGGLSPKMALVALAPLIGVLVMGRCPSMTGFGDVALKKLNACPRAVEALGAPVKETIVGLSCGSYSSRRGSANWIMPVKGPRGSGSFKVSMHRPRGGDWQLVGGTLSVRGADVDVAQCALISGGQAVRARRELAGTVAEASGAAPAEKGSSCTLVVGPGDGPFGCRLALRCEGKLIYGEGSSGYVHCKVQPRPEGGELVSALDNEDSAASGDPILELSERRGELLVSDRAGGKTWSLTIKLQHGR